MVNLPKPRTMSSLVNGDRFRTSDGPPVPIASNMDIPRPDRAKKKNQRRIVIGSLAALALILVSFGVSRLRPAAPTVERSAVWIDTVKRGPMLRQVRGLGTLVPEDIKWIAARTEGRVEQIIARPGKIVGHNDILCVLSNPELSQDAMAADLDAKGAEAKLASLRVELEGK